ncbi:hypothetical protein AN948_06420 [Rhodococcus sp. ADH]|uniref:hypothetical protein n=1 Tax=unclassified Rhodococcus (in: high G+C Gram-positive bacteria) TaxID=192944 RepID=UPI0006BA4B57|nr:MULTISPECIES: hypothetical protein [unclassified Rhodococcus (in: high G+C Gram-positive bacteria)]KPH20499.1 hypothetical protein AN948_06420 [Rhodococcus sp. ADH]RGP44669.1 hypothetical protein AWH04_03220 [Rhodococcus erythropolis]
MKSIAWIAAGGAVLGGVLGIGASYVAASIQVTSAEEQSLEQYRREQRKEVYAEILTGLSNLENFEQSLVISVIFSRDSPNPPVTLDVEPWDDGFKALDDSIAKAKIISSQEVTSISEALKQVHRTVYNDISQVNYTTPDSDLSQQSEAAEAFARIISNLQALGGQVADRPSSTDIGARAATLKEEFIRAAKEDLGLND